MAPRQLREQPAADILAIAVPKLALIMRYARIQQAEFYFSGELLVDVRLTADKFAGPGMVKDLFGKVVRTQEVMKIAAANERDMTVPAILKPSVFKTMVVGEDVIPLYCRTP
jgi:hypothetical protein